MSAHAVLCSLSRRERGGVRALQSLDSAAVVTPSPQPSPQVGRGSPTAATRIIVPQSMGTCSDTGDLAGAVPEALRLEAGLVQQREVQIGNRRAFGQLDLPSALERA